MNVRAITEDAVEKAAGGLLLFGESEASSQLLNQKDAIAETATAAVGDSTDVGAIADGVTDATVQVLRATVGEPWASLAALFVEPIRHLVLKASKATLEADSFQGEVDFTR